MPMKKRLLITLIVIGFLIIIFGGYFYYQTQTPRQKTIREFKNCHAAFSLDKLDFAKPIWNSHLSLILPRLIAMQAFNENDVEKCNYFKGLSEINSNLTVENCEMTYNFLNLIKQLQEGINCQNYVQECKNIIEVDASAEVMEEAKEAVCETYCQSFKNGKPVITDPKNLCEEEPQIDAVDYVDAKTGQSKTCAAGMADEIKFLVAVSKYVPNACLSINDGETQLFCQFYFEKDVVLRKYEAEFEQEYCGLFVGKTLVSP